VDPGGDPGLGPRFPGGIEYAADPESEYYVDAFDPDGRYVCHCSGGTRGALAAARLREMGYRDVAYLEDGFAAREAAGHAVESYEPRDSLARAGPRAPRGRGWFLSGH